MDIIITDDMVSKHQVSDKKLKKGLDKIASNYKIKIGGTAYVEDKEK